MYGGDEDEATGEDLELERYGLTEGQYSGSGESDTEEALYRQVHYDIGNDNNIQSIAEDDAEQTIATSKDPLPSSSRDSPKTNPRKDINDETGIDISDVVAASDDDCSDWKKVECNSKYSVSLRTKTKPGIADISSKSSRKRKAVVVVVSDSAESDIIFLESKTKNQEIVKKEGKNQLYVKIENQDTRFRETVPKKAEGNPRKRSWKNTSNDSATKITKIDRTSWSSAHEGPEGQVGMSESSEVVIIADDSSSSSVLILDSGRSEESKGRPLKDDSEFFLDNKGMALEDVQRDKVSAEHGWKAERMKTKAMLKEGLDIIDVSSGDDDCMVIESCSEEEGMHVHFDEKGERISPEASTSSANNSGKNKGKRKGGEIAAPGRYFVQSRQKHIRCHNCNEMGHLKSECPKPPHVPACVLCGKRGHTDRYCSDALCFNCSLPGHQSRSCPIKRHIRYAKCSRCQMNGHLRKMCPDIWRQYHLTTEHGPIIQPNKKHHQSKRRDVYCSNCSKKGHRYYDCRSEKFDEFVMFTYDKVCVYDRKHIGKMVFPSENKNADYLKLCRERKNRLTSSTKVQGDEPKSIIIEDEPPPTKKQKLTEEEKGREEEASSTPQEENSENNKRNNVQIFVRKPEASSSMQQEPINQDTETIYTPQEAIRENNELKDVLTFHRKQDEPNADQTFGRTKVFRGNKSQTLEQEDEPVLVPSKTQRKVAKTVSEENVSMKISINNKEKGTVHKFVRTRLFGGKRGRAWAEQEDLVITPSRKKQKKPKETNTAPTRQFKAQKRAERIELLKQSIVSQGGTIRLTNEEIKAQEKARKLEEQNTLGEISIHVHVGSKGGSKKLSKGERKALRSAEMKAESTVRLQEKMHIMSQGGSVKLSKKQKKEYKKLLQEQKRKDALSTGLITPEIEHNVHQKLAEARDIKHSATLAMNAVKRQIKAALTKKKEKEPPASMSKSEKKKWNKKIRKEQNKEVRLALKDKLKTDEKVKNVDKVLKNARKLCRDVNKLKGRMYSVPTGHLPGLPSQEQYPVIDDPGYAMSHRGFNLDYRLLEGTHHRDTHFFEDTHYHDNHWSMSETAPWEEAFPRSDVSYNNYRSFVDQPYGYGSADAPYNNSHSLTVPYAPAMTNSIKGNSRHKKWMREGYEPTKTKQ